VLCNELVVLISATQLQGKTATGIFLRRLKGLFDKECSFEIQKLLNIKPLLLLSKDLNLDGLAI